MKQPYIIVSSIDARWLQTAVIEKMEQGYVPTGGMVYSRKEDEYYQTMVLWVEPTVNVSFTDVTKQVDYAKY